MKQTKKLSPSLKSSLYWFVEDLSKGLLQDENWDFNLEYFDKHENSWGKYQKTICDPFVMKQVFSIWSNNIELNEKEEVINDEHSAIRAFQFLRVQFDPNFTYEDIKPPLEDWETKEFEFED